MATVAAGPVFRLLGARDLGDKEDYRVAQMPPVNTDMLEGSGFAARMTAEEVAGVVRYVATSAPAAMQGSRVEVFG